ISNQDLEGALALDFGKLKKVNASFNKLNWYSLPTILEELDFSHNNFETIDIDVFKLRRLNISYNRLGALAPALTPSFANSPFLTHLDCSNNLLTQLDLRSSSKNLIELKCWGNPITNLSLGEVSNLVLFDCLGVKFNNTLPTSTILTSTIYANNPVLLGSTIGLGVYSGISTLCWIILVSHITIEKASFISTILCI
ncbi:11329_t:CDS:2, partial [Racocetra persica]